MQQSQSEQERNSSTEALSMHSTMRRPILEVAGYPLVSGAFITASEDEVRAGVERIGLELRPWLRSAQELTGAPVVLLTVLQGGKFLSRELTSCLSRAGESIEPHEVKASSYTAEGHRSTTVTLDRSLAHLSGRAVLIVDDILDTGNTIKTLREHLTEIGVRDLRVAVLVNKVHPTIAKQSHAEHIAVVHAGHEWLGGAGMEMVGVPDEIARNCPFLIAHEPLV